jgi:hypothetical protein
MNFNTYIRRHGTADTQPFIATLLESAGWNVTTTTASTVASYVSTTAWDLGNSGVAYGVPGNAILVELSDGSFYPVLVAAKATDTITPGMALPSASENAKDIEVMTTMFPQSRVVPASKTLSFLSNLRATHTTGEDLSFDYAGCAVTALGDLTIKVNEMPELAWTLDVSTVADGSLAIADESFVDGQKPSVVTHDARVELATSNDSGGIARTDVILHEATVNWGFTVEAIPGYGSGTLAGIQGYKLVAGTPSITIKGDYTKDYWDDLEGTNPSQYLGIVQPTTALTTPAWGIWMPKCHLSEEEPVIINRDDNLITASVKYIGSVADYNSETDNTDEGAAPIYFAISGAAA